MRTCLLSATACACALSVCFDAQAAPSQEDGDTRVRQREPQPDEQAALLGQDPAPIPFDATASLSGDRKRDGKKRRDRRDGSRFNAPAFRTYDGTDNNPFDFELGATHTATIREASGANYADGIGQMIDGPNARTISNTVSQQTDPLGNARNLSSMVWQWGQFLDHDITLAEGGDEFAPIVVTDPTDPVFGVGAVIPFTRSAFEGGTSVGDPRTFVNGLTHYIDGSMVYGSDEERATVLRSFEGGRLLAGDDGFMRRNTIGFENESGGFLPDEAQFLAGDVRANEQSGLTAMHEVFFRYHNAWADRLAAENTDWDDEQIYQTARKIVGAQVQAITYNDWLDALIGEDALKKYRGYKSDVDPSISTMFSTAAFRLGHTMLTDELERYNADGSVYADGHLSLTDAFFNPDTIATEDTLAAVLRGLAVQQANEIDTQAVESVRSFLFGDPSAGGLDLIALNIQRGRDHGVGDYNTVREDLGLERVDSFDDITSNASLAAALASVYDSVDDIDPWIGLMAEDHVEGGSVGQTLAVILIDQFIRLRDGDRYFYLNDPGLKPYLDEIEDTSLADVISLVTDAQLEGNIFYTDQFLTTLALGNIAELSIAAVPEPASLVLLGMGGVLILGRRRRD